MSYDRDVSTEEILEAALALPEDVRRAFVDRLVASLTPEDADAEDPAFEAELDRREAELASGAVQAIPGPEFLASLRARFSRRATG